MEMEMMEKEINYFGHRHPLTLLKRKEEGGLWCYACDQHPVSVPLYYCCLCNFVIHKHCSELPKKIIKHPLHPQHPLSLLNPFPDDNHIQFNCHSCGNHHFEGFLYRCSQCQFDLDIDCAALIPSTSYEHHNFNHPHPLIFCSISNDSFNYACSCCKLRFNKDHGSICVCLQCCKLLHESCTRISEEINHPFHPEHPLILRPHPANGEEAYFHCRACGELRQGFNFHCSQCQFFLDIHCANLIPTSTKNPEPEPSRDRIFFKLTNNHPHPLIICDGIKNFPHLCSVCFKSLEDFIYVCLQCSILLHKSCAKLPHEISHPFHLQHPLTLFQNLHREFIHCSACKQIYSGFATYRCSPCGVCIDIHCAVTMFPMVKSKIHRHPLALFSSIADSKVNCKSCNLPFIWPSFTYNSPLFRCVDCGFNLHIHCLPNLPPIIIHKCHLHPLTLTYSQLKYRPKEDDDGDDDDDDFFCEACEGKRNLSDPTYYCKECHYVVHVHCVISEVLPFLEKDSSLARIMGNMKMNTIMDEITGNEDEATCVPESSGPIDAVYQYKRKN